MPTSSPRSALLPEAEALTRSRLARQGRALCAALIDNLAYHDVWNPHDAQKAFTPALILLSAGQCNCLCQDGTSREVPGQAKLERYRTYP